MAASKGNRYCSIKHKEQPGFDPTRFTPQKIANKKQIDQDELIAFFADHTLGDCAEHFECTEVTIKRRLRAAGADTSRHNHTAVAYAKIAKKLMLSDEVLRSMFLDQNLDSKTIAEMQDPPVHYNVIRKRLRQLGLTKDRIAVARSMSARHIRKHGIRHPSQRPDVLAKTRRSQIRVRYEDVKGRMHGFRSLTELAYALWLDHHNKEWYYEEMRIPYVDMLTGKHRIYIIDFTVVDGETIEWVEIKPNSKMIPQDKWLYATRRAEGAGAIYRGLHDLERAEMWTILDSDFRLEFIEPTQRSPRSDTEQITQLFKSQEAAGAYRLPGWRRLTTKRYNGSLFTITFARISSCG